MKTYSLHNPLEHGEDLKSLQHALKNAKLYNGKIDGIFGQGVAHACVSAKYRLGYPQSAVVPTGGQMLLDYLQGTKALPPPYKARRSLRGVGLTKAAKQREELVKWALWGAKNEPVIHYTESSSRDDWLYGAPGKLPMYTDCSGFVTACYKWSGLEDPNGLNYKAVGYTGTLLDHGVTIPLSQAKAGDLVIWGAFPGHHTAILVQDGHHVDPMIVSHGWEGGPGHYGISIEDKAQNRSRVIKRYLKD